MPRVSKPAERVLPEHSLVVDNGAYTIKAGFARTHPSLEDCHIIPNCLARDRGKRVWVGQQLFKCQDFGEISFRRPVEKGFLVNWEAEKAIWDSAFLNEKSLLACDPRSTNLLLTEAPNTPSILQRNCDEVVFEEYEFASYSRTLSSSLNAYHDIQYLYGALPREQSESVSPAECLLVIDSGFSHSTVTPLYKGKPIQQAIRRFDVGGKLLTNYLKELVSIRHYNMLDETHLMNEVKEAICFVSQDFRRDMEKTWKGATSSRKNTVNGANDIVIDYVLPDYNAHKSGFMRPHDPSLTAKMRKMGSLAGAGDAIEDYMTLGNERFTVPELLFCPTDVGMKQEGLASTVMQSMSGLPPGLWPAMLANILVVGGNSNLDGFMARLYFIPQLCQYTFIKLDDRETEIRQLAPSECQVRIARGSDPIKSTWLGGVHLANDRAALKRIQVTRQEYQEHGSPWLAKVFAGHMQGHFDTSILFAFQKSAFIAIIYVLGKAFFLID
ncbi:Actin-related protein 6 [Lecanora helva]